MTQKIHSWIVGAAIVLRMATPVFAVQTPSFPICTNPLGTVISSFDSGTHGIVGSSQTYTGSDTVYAVSEGQISQCFCSSDGVGIQTNWWNASSLSEDQVNELKKSGWYYVADGGLWGLDNDPYVAINSTYSCLPGHTGGGGTGGPGDGLSDGRSDGRSSCPECTSVGGGDILGLTTDGEILGLAYTGDMLKILAVFAYAAFFFVIGARFSRKNIHR